MYTEKIHGIVNAKCKNVGKRQSMLKKCSKSSIQGERMIGNNNVRRKNTQNRQCEVKQYSETSMYTEKYLETSM